MYVKLVFVKVILPILVLAAFFFVTPAEAKVLPQAKVPQKSVSASKNVKASVIGISPKLRKDRKALLVNFSNLQNASNVSYLLTYQTNIQDEGAMGSLNLAGGSNQTSELLLGTCSKNVCRYHTGIKNARLEVNYTTKSGKKYLKKYRIKV